MLGSKKEIRQKILLERSSLSQQKINIASRAIANNIIEYFNFESIRTIHVYLPIRSRNEVDTFSIISLINHHYDVKWLVPKVIGDEIISIEFDLTTELEENDWHIPEPISNDSVSTIPDMVLLPMLAFDYQGNRVGYGKGYYDRFLADKPSTIKVGLCMQGPVEGIIDTNEWDIVLDYAVCPDKIYDFKFMY